MAGHDPQFDPMLELTLKHTGAAIAIGKRHVQALYTNTDGAGCTIYVGTGEKEFFEVAEPYPHILRALGQPGWQDWEPASALI